MRSAYKIAVEMATKHTGSSSKGISYGFFGRRFGSCIHHIKYGIFLRGRVVNILPTKSNLKHRGVIQKDKCSICGEGVKDSGHVFWLCSKAKEVWSGSKFFLLG